MARPKPSSKRRPPALFPAMPDVPTMTIPVSWIEGLLRAEMKKHVAPATMKTRRMEKIISMKAPMEVVERLLAPFETNEIADLEWEELPGKKFRLKPTKITSKNLFYKYQFTSGAKTDKLFRLHDFEQQKSLKHTQWRRGRGAARLHLSQRAADRGDSSALVALACGQITIDVKQPRNWAAMPDIRVRMKTLSMDRHGHIILPCEFKDAAYKASLRKQAKALLQEMINSTLYPTPPQLTDEISTMWSHNRSTSIFQPAPQLPAAVAPLLLTGQE